MKDIYSSSSNSTKKSNDNKNNKIKRSKPKRIALFIGKALVSLFLIGVITVCIVSTALTVYVMKSSEEESEISLAKEDLQDSGLTTITADDPENEGQQMVVARISSGVMREWVDIQDVPDHVRNAFVAIEDKRFYDHKGVDFKRTFTAFLNMFLHFWDTEQGGSTITQQLVKNLTNDNDHSSSRKIREIFRAMSLENTYTKEDILQAYLNVVAVGGNNGNYEGVGAAAKIYYNKEVSELTIAEAASIASITKNPVKLDPINNPEANQKRRDTVLENMLDQGYITEAEYTEAVNTPVTTNPGSFTPDENGEEYSPFVDTVIREVVSDLNEEFSWGYDLDVTEDWNAAWEKVKEKGYTIYSTMDVNMQSQIESSYQQSATFSPSASFISSNTSDNPVQSAMVVFGYDGSMKAVAGKIGALREGYVNNSNYATQGTRSPGSAIKPLSVYTPAIDNGLVNYSTIIKDEDRETANGWWPTNYNNSNYGSLTVAEAVERSANKIAASIVLDMGYETSYDFMTNKLKIDLNSDDNNLAPMSVGSLTYGARLSQLTNAFQIFGNGGYLTESHSYTTIKDYANETVYEKNLFAEQVISEDTSSIMNRILYRVTTERNGTARGLGDFSGIEVIGKTGTTNDNNDLTFIGATPDYVAGIWLGHENYNADIQAKVNNGTVYRPYQIWKNVMTQLVPSGSTTTFTLSDSIQVRDYCTTTGLLANGNCPTAKGYYSLDNLPGTCTSH